MDNLIEFLTSSNAIIIYITCFVLCMGVFISYYLKKNSNKRRQKQNTKELENIVANEKEEKIETVVEQKEEIEPVTITKVVPLENVDIIEELSKDIKEEPQVQEVKVQEEPTNVETNVTSEAINKEEEKKEEVKEEKEEAKDVIDIEAKPEITFDDFEKLQFQVGEIIACEEVKKSRKLLCSQVKIGSQVRQIVSGIKAHYSAEEMVGKKVMVVTNLKPAKLAGILSEGMILCAEDADGNLSLMVPEKEMPAGAEIC